jgi:hypothetical protein
MTLFADIKSEPAIKTQFDSLYTLSTASFQKRWLTNNFPSMLHCESMGAGQWMAYLLGLRRNVSDGQDNLHARRHEGLL